MTHLNIILMIQLPQDKMQGTPCTGHQSVTAETIIIIIKNQNTICLIQYDFKI